MSKQQLRFFERARNISLLSSERTRHGSVIVKSGRVIHAGFNRGSEINWRNKRGFWTLHSEIAACLGVSRDLLDGAVMYNWRETKDYVLADSAPCPLCFAELQQLGIRKVYYTTTQPPFLGEITL